MNATKYHPLRWLALILPLLFGVACQNGTTARTGPQEPFAITLYGKIASQVILTPFNFLSDGEMVTLGTTGGPGGRVRWSIGSGNAASLSTSDPRTIPGLSPVAPSPPPNDTFVTMTKRARTLAIGRTMVVARSGNAMASIPVYSYDDVALGCRLRYRPYLSFDGKTVTSPRANDLYITEPTHRGGMFDSCTALGLISKIATIHFPHGGVVLPMHTQAFPHITASQWRNVQTQAPQGNMSIIIFKTQAGAIVKAILPDGPMEMTGPNGQFPF